MLGQNNQSYVLCMINMNNGNEESKHPFGFGKNGEPGVFSTSGHR
jgi:hypothetical protein